MLAHKVAGGAPAEPLMSDRGGDLQVHVVLPAYRAAETIAAVAGSMPVEAADRALLVDDASPDETSEVALRSRPRRAAPSRQPRLRREPEDAVTCGPSSTAPTSS